MHTHASLLTTTPPKPHLSLQKVIEEMNAWHDKADLSYGSMPWHSKPLKVSKAPVIFSHSAAKAVCDNMLNIPDDILSATW